MSEPKKKRKKELKEKQTGGRRHWRRLHCLVGEGGGKEFGWLVRLGAFRRPGVLSVHDLEPHEGVVRRSSWWWVVRHLVVDVGSAVYGESYTWFVRCSASTICRRTKGWLICREEGERSRRSQWEGGAENCGGKFFGKKCVGKRRRRI